jgi:alpha-L-rhamnosidase
MYKIILFILFSSQVLSSQIKKDWAGQWIGEGTNVEKNTWTCYRKDAVLKVKKGQSIKVNIACDSKYWLYVNGKMVVFEGQLKRGPNPLDTYYDEVEVGEYLKNGKNKIGVLVWYFGKDGFSHKSSGKAGLLFDMRFDSQQIISDATWKVRRHKAYGNTQKPEPNYRLPESNIYFDAQKDLVNWYSDNQLEKWANALLYGKAPCLPWGDLHLRPIPQWENSGLKEYLRLEKEIVNDTLTVKAYLPQNMMVTPYLEIHSDNGKLIDIRTDNYYGGGEPNIRTEYITKKGKQSFESFAFINGHYVIYRMPKDVKILSLKYRETRYSTSLVGSFQSSDKDLNVLHQKSLNTLRVGLRDHIHDCPDRERALWWGDVVITMGELFYAADKEAHKAIKKAIHELVDWQRKDSVLFSPVPAGNWKTELPGQMLASVGKLGFWKYYEHTGDKATIEAVYPAVKKYLALYELDKDGLVKHREGDWMWHDWGEKVDVAILDNVWYYLALNGATNMAKLLNNEADEQFFLSKMNVMRPAFQKAFWDGKGFRSEKYAHQYDDRAQGMAVIAGLTEPSQWPEVKSILATTFNAGAYMEKYILESYFIMNDAEEGLKRMKNRYQKMIESKHTTLWEGWDIGSAIYGGGTYNHGWTGGPLTLMHQYIAGVKSSFSNEISIYPQPANLLNYEVKTNTHTGIITQRYERKEDKIILDVDLPISAKAIIGFPKIGNKKYMKVMINNIVISPTAESDQYYQLQISGGKSIIEGYY